MIALKVKCWLCCLAGRAPFSNSVSRMVSHMKEISSSSRKLRGRTWQHRGIRFPLKLEPLLGTNHTVWAQAECWLGAPSRQTFPRPAGSHRPIHPQGSTGSQARGHRSAHACTRLLPSEGNGDGAGGEKQGGAPGSWSPAANSRQLTGVYPFDVLERRGFET